LIRDAAPEGNLNLHEVSAVVESGEVDGLAVRYVAHLVDTEILKYIVYI
jgi:hypothetical protein